MQTKLQATATFKCNEMTARSNFKHWSSFFYKKEKIESTANRKTGNRQVHYLHTYDIIGSRVFSDHLTTVPSK